MPVLNTRIQLKYDTLINWNASNLVLNKGEIAIAVIETANPAQAHLQPVMFKVGDGFKTFSQLDWASAKAADVYEWAKKSGITVTDPGSTSGKFVTSLSWDNETKALVITRADVDWDDVKNKVMASAEADGLMSKTDFAKLDAANFTTGAGVVAGLLNEDALAQVKANVTVDKATNAEHAASADEASKVTNKLTIGEQTFDGSSAEDFTATVESLAAAKINSLIKAADDKGGETIESIANLVDYVEQNGGNIAQLITDVGTANTNASNAVETANTANITAGEAKTLAQEAKDAATNAQTGAAASAAAAAESASDASDSADAAAGSATDAAGSATAAAGSANAAAQSATDATQAKNDADAAKSAAQSAQAAAEAAKSGAETAQAAAQSSKEAAAQSATSADTAKGAAETAQEAAEQAQAKAEAAQAAAEQAKTDADGILTQVTNVATGAQATANEAKALANEAVSTANTAKAAANTALQNIKAGTGLKVSEKDDNEQTIDFDETVVFVFNCGNADVDAD